jgi:hypothetical protein
LQSDARGVLASQVAKFLKSVLLLTPGSCTGENEFASGVPGVYETYTGDPSLHGFALHGPGDRLLEHMLQTMTIGTTAFTSAGTWIPAVADALIEIGKCPNGERLLPAGGSVTTWIESPAAVGVT